MYLAQTFKFRFGEKQDFFHCTFYPNFFVRRIKECVVYFLYIDGELMGPYKTYSNADFYDQSFEIIELIHENKVLVLESRQVSQEVLREKLYLRLASYEDIKRNTVFFEYVNNRLNGPFSLHTDISLNDTGLVKKLNLQQIYVINERQNFKK